MSAKREIKKLIDAAERRLIQEIEDKSRAKKDADSRIMSDCAKKINARAISTLRHAGFVVVGESPLVSIEPRSVIASAGRYGYGHRVYYPTESSREYAAAVKRDEARVKKMMADSAAVRREASALNQAVTLTAGKLDPSLVKKIESFCLRSGQAMMHPVEEVRVRSTHARSVEGSCYIGLAGDDLVRIRSVNGHVFHVRWGQLSAVIERMRREEAANPPLFGK